jgi:hypothetical protein
VGGPNTWSVRRPIAFAAVVAFHVGLLIVLTIALRTGVRRSAPVDLTTTFISLPSPTPPAVNRPPPPILTSSAPISPVEPPALPPPRISVQSGADTSIDWDSEARRAAGAAMGPPHPREFGRTPEAPSWLGPTRPPTGHQAGEQYRSDTGDWIVWVSDRCYIVSGVPPLGAPDVLARSIPTRTVCEGDSGPRSDLFKDSLAYKKYHPQ